MAQRQLSGVINYGAMETALPPRPPPPSHQTSQDLPPRPSPPSSLQQQSAQPPPVVPAGNPFTSSTNPFRQEPVQPQAQDMYMHGTIQDRTY